MKMKIGFIFSKIKDTENVMVKLNISNIRRYISSSKQSALIFFPKNYYNKSWFCIMFIHGVEFEFINSKNY